MMILAIVLHAAIYSCADSVERLAEHLQPHDVFHQRLCSKFSHNYDEMDYSITSNRNGLNSIGLEENPMVVIGNLINGRVLVTLYYGQEDQMKNEVKLWIRVFGYVNTAISRQNLPAMHVITSDDIKVEIADVASRNLNKNDIPALVVGKVTRKPIARYQPLSSDVISDPPLIKTGQPVKLVLTKDNVTIVTSGVARETAWKLHDKTRVAVTGSLVFIDGIAVEKGEVHASL